MLAERRILVSLLSLVEHLPSPPPPQKRQRGRQDTYSDKLFIKTLIVMIIRRLYTAYALLDFLAQPDRLARQVRSLLTEDGRFPARRTWERRFEKLPARLPALIGCWAACWLHACNRGRCRDGPLLLIALPCGLMAASGIKSIA